MLTNRMVSAQTGPEGLEVNKLLIAAGVLAQTGEPGRTWPVVVAVIGALIFLYGLVSFPQRTSFDREGLTLVATLAAGITSTFRDSVDEIFTSDYAITAQNKEQFIKEYKFTLETCYACHKASDKPYLRPKLPERPV